MENKLLGKKKDVFLISDDVSLLEIFSIYQESPHIFESKTREDYARKKELVLGLLAENADIQKYSSVFNEKYVFPEKVFVSPVHSQCTLWEVEYDFSCFLMTAWNAIDNYEPSFIELKTERQASPPFYAYEPFLHNKEIYVKKMNYSYLY